MVRKARIRLASGAVIALAVLMTGMMSASAGPGGTPPDPEQLPVNADAAVDETAEKLSSYTDTEGYSRV